METEMDEVLVLNDEDGTYYVVPRSTLERFQVADDQKAAIDALLGEEVVGYLMGQSTYVTEQLVSTYQAEKRHEGAQERLAHAALHPTTDESTAGPAPTALGLPRRLVARFIRLGRAQEPRTSEAES